MKQNEEPVKNENRIDRNRRAALAKLGLGTAAVFSIPMLFAFGQAKASGGEGGGGGEGGSQGESSGGSGGSSGSNGGSGGSKGGSGAGSLGIPGGAPAPQPVPGSGNN